MTTVAKIVTNIAPAVDLLKSNQVVAIPTETVYGLAANALSPEACQRIYEAKKRPSDNPLIVHVSSIEMLKQVIEPTLFSDCFVKKIKNEPLVDRLRVVTETFWPGPLTLIVPKHLDIPSIVCGAGQLDTVAVRFPSHPVTLQIITSCGFPLAAPSANLSGRPSPTTALHVFEDLHDRIQLIVDAGACSLGVESTVLDITQPKPTILRPGSITIKQLRTILPDCEMYIPGMDGALEERPPTPGLKYRHYSPNAPVILCSTKEMADKFCTQHQDKFIIRLIYGDNVHDENVFTLAKLRTDYAEIAQNLFAALRDADARRPDFIVAEACDEIDEGAAVMNRLVKAAHAIL